MERKPKSKKIILLIIPVALVLIAGALLGFFYFPAQKTYKNALAASRELPYEEAFETLKTAIQELDGNPLFTGKQSELAVILGELTYDHIYETAMDQSGDMPYDEACAILRDAMTSLEGKPQYTAQYEALRLQLLEMTKAEIEYAIDEDETAYALTLIPTLTAEQAQPFYDMIYEKAGSAAASGDKRKAIELFEQLGSFSDAQQRAADLRAQLRFEDAAAVFTGGNYDEGIAAFLALGTEEGNAAAEDLAAKRLARRAALRTQGAASIAAGAWHTAWLSNGTIRFAGDARYTVPETALDRVFSGLTSIVGLKDGRVILFGESFGSADTINALSGVTDMGLGINHALFLLENGTVASVGSKALGKLNTADWTNITDVAAGAWHSVGSKSDGTVVTVGSNDLGQCDTADWSDVVSVDAGLWHTVGLRSDGTVVACGDNTYGQCDVADWTDIAAISCGACFTVGLRADGTVVACGDNGAGQCGVSGWTEVAAVDAGAYHTAAVRMDGTLLCAGTAPHEALPEAPVFDSDYAVDAITAPAAAENIVETCYIEGLDSEFGPWLYLDPHGAALICVDDSEERTPLRADLLATADALPQGHVVSPRTENNDADVVLRNLEVESPDLQAQKAHAVVGFTGDYLGFTSNTKGVMMRNGIVYYDRAEIGSLAILPDGTLRYYKKGETSAEQLLSQGVRDSFSFWPLLVQDGVNILENNADTQLYTMRVAFGYSDPYHYLTVVSLRNRLRQFSHLLMADTMVGYGARLAYNLDGGHSSSLVFMGRDLSKISFEGERYITYRPLSDIIVFLENPAVQPPAEETP